jgi:PadR family transcriptional regulator, regulatory protein PadR
MVLLALLREGEMYGYEVASELERRSEGRFEIGEGTLYPVFYRLEKEGYVEPTWRPRERGVPRKYYRLTPAGARALGELVAQWRAFTATVDRLLDRPEGGTKSARGRNER